MQLWRRRILIVLAAMLLLVLAVATWLVLSFDASRHKQTAIDWVQARYQRELAIDGAVELQLLPHPAVALHGVRLSAAGQPQLPFASIDSAALSLRLWPLLTQREVLIDRLDAKGVRVQWQRDAEGRSNIDDLLRPATPAEAGPQRSSPVELAGAELTDIELSVADAVSGVQGRFAIEQLTLGALGTDRPAPLNLKARAELRVPAVNAALELDTELALQSPADGSAATHLTLTKTRLQLRGDGFDIKGLDAKLQAELEGVATKNGFANFAELDDVAANISMVMAGLDPQSGDYMDPIEAIKKEMEEIKKDDKIPEKDKKQMLEEMDTALKTTPPLQYKENVALVKKFQKDIEKALQ